jgi:hypothetical protein
MDNIFKYQEIEHSIFEHYKSGGGKTFYLGFPNLAKHYSIMEGSRTDWTGYPGSGKTELLLECLVNTSEWYGHKHLIHMPDAGSTSEVIAKIMHKMSGKQFKEFYYNAQGEKVKIENRLSELEITRLLPKVLDKFIIYKPQGKASKAITPKELWQFGADNKKELNLFSVVIDSWNYMRHEVTSGMRYDQYLEDVLSFGNDLCEASKLHFHTIIHPKSPVKINGKAQIPDMHELKGGSEWGNNGKSIIIVHRDFDSVVTEIKVNKAKPEVIGVRGVTSLMYNVKTGKFNEDGNIAKPLKETHTQIAIAPNNSFDNLPF